MKINMNRSHLFHITSFVFIFLFCVHPSHCDHHGDQLSACRGDYAYKCGSGSLNISYPFWGGDRHQYCGHKGFEIKCDESEQYPFIEMATRNFKVLNISYADTKMTLVHAVTWNDHCAEIILHDNTFFDSVQFKYTTRDENLSFFYDCDEEISHQSFNYFNCSVDNEVMNGFYTIQTREHQFHNRSSSCKKGIKIPVLASAGDDLVLGRLEEALMKGFEVEYNADNMHCAGCLATGGICAASNRSNAEQFVCLCPDQTCPPQPSPGMHSS